MLRAEQVERRARGGVARHEVAGQGLDPRIDGLGRAHGQLGGHAGDRASISGFAASLTQCTSDSRSAAGSVPPPAGAWCSSNTSRRLFKTGGRLIQRARYFILHLAESHLTRRLSAQILGHIERPARHPT